MNFNETENRLEAKLKRELRSEILIAQFQDGFAAGWRMAVLDSFREALDIRLLPRMKAGKEVLVWTQGPFFSFKRGDILYDTPKAYQAWDKSNRKFQLMIQIQADIPVGYKDPQLTSIKAPWLMLSQQRPNQKAKIVWANEILIEDFSLDPGYVKFKVWKAAERKGDGLETVEFECTQNDFVLFLQSGVLNRRKKSPIDLFIPWENKEPQVSKVSNPILPGFA